MYTVQNVINVKGHPVQCTLVDADNNHVQTFYWDADTKEIWCQNNEDLIQYGQYPTVSHHITAKTKKQAEAFFMSSQGLEIMVNMVCNKAAASEMLATQRLAAYEVAKAEAEEEMVHEALTPVTVDSIKPIQKEVLTMFKLKSKVMPIHNALGHTVCTPDGFALKARCERLKRELKANRALTGV